MRRRPRPRPNRLRQEHATRTSALLVGRVVSGAGWRGDPPARRKQTAARMLRQNGGSLFRYRRKAPKGSPFVPHRRPRSCRRGPTSATAWPAPHDARLGTAARPHRVRRLLPRRPTSASRKVSPGAPAPRACRLRVGIPKKWPLGDVPGSCARISDAIRVSSPRRAPHTNGGGRGEGQRAKERAAGVAGVRSAKPRADLGVSPAN